MSLSSEVNKFLSVLFLNYPIAKCSNTGLLVGLVEVSQKQNAVTLYHLVFGRLRPCGVWA